MSRLTRIAATLAAGCIAATPGAFAGTLLPSISFGDLAIQLNPIATGLSAPDYAISAPGDLSNLFVVEQNGLLRVIQNGGLLAAPAMDIGSLVAPPLVTTNANDERGFLGLAFHPDYNNAGSAGSRTLYTYNSQLIAPGTGPTFVAPNGATQGYKNVINEWKMGANNQVDVSSRREVVSFGKNANNHNGGTIAFGPDGYLYLGLGDGGNANDVGASHIEPGGNAQNLATPLGKMLRIDPINPTLTPASANALSGNGQYRIPTDNPFQGAGQVKEIYAYGFRNPYRFSFDRANGQLIVADVGQNNVEEIDRVVRGGNFGWAIKEGDFLFISAFSQSAQVAYAVSNLFRQRGAVTVLGGPHARCYPEDSQKYFDYVLGFTDRTVIDEVLHECAQHRPLGRQVSAEQQPQELPTLQERWSFIESTLAKAPLIKFVPMIGSLGCPYTCSFCIDSTVDYKPLSFEQLRQDLVFLLGKHKRPIVGWHDPNFGVRFNDYMEAVEAADPDKRIRHIAESSLSLLSEPHLKRLRSNNFQAILPGIES